jgi:IS5 family transposase
METTAGRTQQFKVYTANQKRGLTPTVKRYLRRRSAVEPVIGHAKNEHRMGRNYLAHATGDAINAVLAAVGYNFSLLLNWLKLLWALFMAALATLGIDQNRSAPA